MAKSLAIELLYERNTLRVFKRHAIFGNRAKQNKDFRIFVANGYYDLATPFFTEHSMNHMVLIYHV